MKICPKCSQTYGDSSLNYCLMDGAVLDLMEAGTSNEEVNTVILKPPAVTASNPPFDTRNAYAAGTMFGADASGQPQRRSRSWVWALAIFGVLIILIGGGIFAMLALNYVSKSDGPANVVTSPSPLPTSRSNMMAGPPSTPSTDSSDLTIEKFNQLKAGMPRSEVERILGGKGTVVAPPSGYGGMKFSVNKWDGENFKSIIIAFQNDKIMTLSQVGLK